jgi:hypothetical protein
MTDEQINIAIAEACGRVRRPDGYWFPPGSNVGSAGIANYCNDLNAMHDAIMSLPSGVRDNSFTSQLAMVCGFKAHGSDAWSELHQGRCAVINSTARQRAEALLKTIGKWEEPE